MNPYSLKPDSWLHDSHQMMGDGLFHALKDYARKYSGIFHADQFCMQALHDVRTHALSTREVLAAFTHTAHERFGDPDVKQPLATLVEGQKNVFSLRAAQHTQQASAAKHLGDLNTITIDDVLKTHAKLNPGVNVAEARLLPSNILQSWEKLETQHKVNVGMWGIGAALGAFSTLSAARYSVARNEDGKAQVQWSQVGVCLLQATMTAACAYMGMKAFQGHSIG